MSKNGMRAILFILTICIQTFVGVGLYLLLGPSSLMWIVYSVFCLIHSYFFFIGSLEDMGLMIYRKQKGE